MARSSVKLKDLVIPNGAAVSNILKASDAYGDAEHVMLTCENVNDGAITYSVDVTDDPEPSATGTWRTFQVFVGASPNDLALPNANTKAVTLPEGILAATGFRIHASGNVTADRTFGASKQYFDDGFGY